MDHFLKRKIFKNKDDVERAIKFIDSKNIDFLEMAFIHCKIIGRDVLMPMELILIIFFKKYNVLIIY